MYIYIHVNLKIEPYVSEVAMWRPRPGSQRGAAGNASGGERSNAEAVPSRGGSFVGGCGRASRVIDSWVFCCGFLLMISDYDYAKNI